jgi:hypothetical protein
VVGRPPSKRSDARSQLGHGERLRWEVVGAGVETGDAGGDGRLRRQHQNRRRQPLPTDPLAPGEPAPIRKSQVENDRVEDGSGEGSICFVEAVGGENSVFVLPKGAGDDLDDLLVILHEQHAHRLQGTT